MSNLSLNSSPSLGSPEPVDLEVPLIPALEGDQSKVASADDKATSELSGTLEKLVKLLKEHLPKPYFVEQDKALIAAAFAKQCEVLGPQALDSSQRLTPYQGPCRAGGVFTCLECPYFWETHNSYRNQSDDCPSCGKAIYPFKQYNLHLEAPTGKDGRPKPVFIAHKQDSQAVRKQPPNQKKSIRKRTQRVGSTPAQQLPVQYKFE